MDYPIICTSTKEITGIDKLKEIIKGKCSLFSGQSGVGKSSLANELTPKLFLKTSVISDKNNKGQHTTTFAEMHDWHFGGSVIDTPGIKEFGLVNIEKFELQDFFLDIFKLSKHCKFKDCLHLNEPKCAVKEALKNKTMAESRYNNYLHLLEDYS